MSNGWIRQLPSGLWAATVRTPAGRITKTDRIRQVVADWADEMKVDKARGDFIDPRNGQITVGEWWERCRDARHREKASRKRDESHWRCHVEPRWGPVPIGSILKPDVSAWVVQMDCDGVGAATIEGAVKVLRGLLEQAVDARMIRHNPATKVDRPRPAASTYRILHPDEEDVLLARLDVLFPDRPDGRLFVELMLDTGMRFEEAAALPPEMVDTRRQRLHVGWVMERDGTARPYAKSEAGNRSIGYGDHLAGQLAAAKLAAPVVPGVFPQARRGAANPTRLLFFSPGGGGASKRKRGEPGPVRYSNWLGRVWRSALLDADGAALLDDPQPTPHDLRHTYGTRLADQGVPQHEIMALMGHKDQRASAKYIHAGEDRFQRARDALDRAVGRVPKPRGSDHGESPVSQGPFASRRNVSH